MPTVRYHKIFSNIWNDEKFGKLSSGAKMLFLYYLTCEYNNALGMFIMRDGYATSDLHYSLKRYKRCRNELVENGFIGYDESTSLLLIKNQLRYNTIDGPNQLMAAIKIAESLGHRNSPLMKELSEIITKIKKETIKEKKKGKREDDRKEQLSHKMKNLFNYLIGILNGTWSVISHKALGKTTRQAVRDELGEGLQEGFTEPEEESRKQDKDFELPCSTYPDDVDSGEGEPVSF